MNRKVKADPGPRPGEKLPPPLHRTAQEALAAFPTLERPAIVRWTRVRLIELHDLHSKQRLAAALRKIGATAAVFAKYKENGHVSWSFPDSSGEVIEYTLERIQ